MTKTKMFLTSLVLSLIIVACGGGGGENGGGDTCTVPNGTTCPCPAGTEWNSGSQQCVAVIPPDTTNPVVVITSPAENASVSGTVAIEVTATDASGISDLYLKVNGAVYSTTYTGSGPYQFDWTCGPAGAYTLEVCAHDGSTAANLGCSAIVNVTVPQPVDLCAQWRSDLEPGGVGRLIKDYPSGVGPRTGHFVLTEELGECFAKVIDNADGGLLIKSGASEVSYTSTAPDSLVTMPCVSDTTCIGTPGTNVTFKFQ